MEWTFSDGWILAATYLSQGNTGACLSDVIGVADGINHAIPNVGELSDAYTKLSQAGLLTVVEGRYVLSPDAMSGLEGAMERRGGAFEIPNKAHWWVKRAGLEVQNDLVITVTEAEVQDGYDEYISKIKKRD